MKRVVFLLLVAACSKGSSEAPAAAPPPAADKPAADKPAEKPHHHEDRNDPAEATPPLALDIKVDGAASKWQQDVFDKTPHIAGQANSGESRDVWSLRELVHANVGPKARVVAVVGESRQEIDAAAWNDPARVPIVHRTRRGTLKFRWTDKDGKWGETAVKEVTGLEISAK